MEYKDYCQILGVDHQATQEQIKKAFGKKARLYHPDVSKEENAEAMMKDVNEANAVLSDLEKRAAYDSLGSASPKGPGFRPPPGWNEGFEFSGDGMSEAQAVQFSDFFFELFGDRMRNRGSQTHPGRAGRGEDHHTRIVLDLEDAYLGASKTLSLRCPRVDADGRLKLAEHTVVVQIPLGVRDDAGFLEQRGEALMVSCSPYTRNVLPACPHACAMREVHADRHAPKNH